MMLIGRFKSIIGNYSEFHRHATNSVKIEMMFFIYWWCIVPQRYTIGSGITNWEWNVSVNVEIVGRVLEIFDKEYVVGH